MESGEHRGESKIEPFTLYQEAYTSFSVTIKIQSWHTQGFINKSAQKCFLQHFNLSQFFSSFWSI